MKPSEIRYTQQQLEDFILPHLFELRMGEWPDGISEDECYSGSHSYTAPFALACEVAGEVDARLAMVPSNVHEMMLAVYTLGYAVYEHARQTNQDADRLESERRWCLRYISGNRRKRTPYKDWKAITRSRKNVSYPANNNTIMSMTARSDSE